MIKKIFIHAGHSSKDSGASTIDGKITERDIINGICTKIYEQVKGTNLENLFYIENLFGETHDSATSAKVINAICKKDGLTDENSLLISIHCDYSGATSGELAYYYGGSNLSKKFAQTIMAEMSLIDKRAVPDTSSRFGRIGIVRDTIPLACLIECGSLGADFDYLLNKQDIIAKDIINAALTFANITPVPTEREINIQRIKEIWLLADKLINEDIKGEDKVNILREIQDNAHLTREYISSI